jgi:O-antigen/teichoic acid export membrane protein
MLSRGLLGFLAFALCYWETRSLPISFLAEAAAWWLCLRLVDQPLLDRLQARVPLGQIIKVPPAEIAKLALWNLPLGLAIFLMLSSASVPNLVLERERGLAALGVFGAIAYINIALNTFSSAIGTASAARLRRLYRTGARARFLRLSLRLTLLAASIGAALWLAALFVGEWALNLLYGPEFVQGQLLQIALLAAALRITAAPLQFSMTAGQAFKRRMKNNALTFVVALAASLALIPRFGASGAAWTLVALSAVNLILTINSFRLVLSRIPSQGDVETTFR